MPLRMPETGGVLVSKSIVIEIEAQASRQA